MLRSLKDFIGFELDNTDGSKGVVADFLFHDDSWDIKHVEIDLGAILPGKKVLLNAEHLRVPERRSGQLKTNLTCQEVQDLPPLKTDKPVAMQWENRIEQVQSKGENRVYFLGKPFPTEVDKTKLKERAHDFDYNLRALGEVEKYKVLCLDHEFGALDDMIVDTETWEIKSIVVATRNWFAGKRVMVPPNKIAKFDWVGKKVFIPMTKNEIFELSTFYPKKPVNEGKNPSSFTDYFGRKANASIDYHTLF